VLPPVRGDGDVRAGRNSELGCSWKLRQFACVHDFANKVLWVYIILLLVGGLIGFFKAKSKVSLITSAVFAAILVLTVVPGVFQPAFARGLANVIMALLLVVFAIRLAKTKKFMPSGLMLVVTIAALVLQNFFGH
jgi:uncharacterized membrane protein (UPF0136 family)